MELWSEIQKNVGQRVDSVYVCVCVCYFLTVLHKNRRTGDVARLMLIDYQRPASDKVGRAGNLETHC